MTSRGHANNFDLIRLLAAAAVIFSHSYAVLGMEEPAPFINPLGLAWGNLGVLVFFSISGYLVAQSYDRDPSVRRYASKRLLRVLPGLAVVTTISTVLLGPFVTSAFMREHFADLGTYLYPVATTMLFLPSRDPVGMFDGNPRTDINASLWTIPVEVLCYILLVLVVRFRLGGPRLLLPAIVAVAILGNEHLGDAAGRVPGAPSGLPLNEILLLGAAFFTGALLYRTRDKLSLNLWVGLGVGAVAIALRPTVLGPTAGAVLIPYLVLTLALCTRPVPLKPLRGYDVSYGLYLLGYPIQQTLVYALGENLSPWLIAGLTLLIASPLAALSWRFVERPALARKPVRATRGDVLSAP